MSVLTDVLREARSGATTDRIAANLGIDTGLAEAAVDHWVRLGIMSRSSDVLGDACHGCEPSPGRSLACAGCVFAKRAPGR
ncbi:MAG: hypothetical protein ACOH17_07395 [Cellulomonas sp.]